MKNYLQTEILKTLPYPYYIIDANSLIVVESNDPTFKIGQKCTTLLYSQSSNCQKDNNSQCVVKKVLREKKTVKIKLTKVQNGEAKSVWVYANPIYNDQKCITHVIEYIIDITEQETLKEQIDSKNHDLEDAVTNLSFTNKELNRTNTKYKALFENSPESLWEEDFTDLMLHIEELKANGISNFRQYFEENPQILAELAERVVIVDVNQATLQLYKAKSKEELIGNLPKTFLPESLSVFKEELLSIIEGKNHFSQEARVKTLKGDILNVIIKLSYTKQKDNKYIAYVSTSDITERKMSESALQKSQHIFERVMDSIDALVYVSDMESYDILFMNKMMKDNFGNSVGTKCYSTIQKGQNSPCNFCTNHLLLKNGKPSGVHNWEFQNTVNNRWYYISDLAIEWIDGRTVRFEIATDITDLKVTDLALKKKNTEFLKLNEELQSTNHDYEVLNEEYREINNRILKSNIELEKAKEKAVESDRLKSAFLANMSHEIRTPMNTIVGFSDLLGTPNLVPERRHKFLKLVQSSSEHLLRIIDDIIDISKIESNQLKIKKASCGINDLLREIRESQSMMKIVKRKSKISLHLNIPDDSDNLNIICDPTRFRQIVYNLVSNAYKYTKEGYVEIGYEILTEVSKIKVFVKDTGFGIQAEMFQTIFERFRQIENQNLQEGTGIGLSITKGLVQLLDGEIWLESVVDEGTTFYFTMPISTGKEQNPIITQLEQNNPKFDLSNCLVYIAEDDISSFLLIEELLEDSNLLLKHVTNGKDLIDLIDKQIPDLVLLDINMPIMNGFEAAREIRKNHPKLPIIAQTAYAMSEERERCLKSGCSDYISKPINAELLTKKITNYLSCHNQD